MFSHNNKNIYSFEKEDLIKTFEFVKNYHLEETKGSRGRTTAGPRGFGGELDSFLPGKLLEYGTAKIIEKYSLNKKKLLTDEVIYTNSEVSKKADPDIISIIHNSITRSPNLHIEIKRIEDNSSWLGIRTDQLESTRRIKGEDILDKIFIIHPKIFFDDEKNKKEQDVVASILKELISDNNIKFNDFSSFYDLKCKIEYIYSIKDLLNFGYEYKKGNIIPYPGFDEAANAYNSNGLVRKNYNSLHKLSGENELGMKIENLGVIPEFGKFKLEGEFEIFINDKYKNNHKSYIYCHTDIIMKNNFFGTYNLKKGLTYNFHFKNKQGNPRDIKNLKSINDWWFLRKRLDELIIENKIKSVQENLQYISDTI